MRSIVADDFSMLLFREQTLEATAAHVARLAVETFTSCDAASVIVMSESGKAALEATDDVARSLSGAQIAMAEGPAYDAAQYLRPVVIESTSREREWPQFCALASRLGIESALVLPLDARGEKIGALSLYCVRPHGFPEVDDVSAARRFATQAGIAIANALDHSALQETMSQLNRALETRAVIEQAKGIIMAAERCSADDAFAILKRESQHQNRKLHAIAQEIVEAAQQPKDPLDRRARVALVARALTSALEPAEVVDIVVRQGMAGMGAGGGLLALVDGDQLIVPVMTEGYSAESVAALSPLTIDDELPLSQAVRDREAVWVGSRAEAQERFPRMAARWADTDSHAWAAIPLVNDGEVLGVLGVSFTAPRLFTSNERLFMGALADLTALALRGGLAEPLLPPSAPRFDAIVAHEHDVISVIDSRRRFVYVNPALQAMLGRDPEDHIGRFAWELVHPDDRPSVTEQYRDILGRPGESVTFTCRLAHADGSYRHVEIHQVNRLHDPAVRGFVGNMRDITDRLSEYAPRDSNPEPTD